MHLFGCQNKSTCLQKFKSSNVFYARACAANDAGRKVTGGPPQELAAKRLVSNICNPICCMVMYISISNVSQ